MVPGDLQMISHSLDPIGYKYMKIAIKKYLTAWQTLVSV